MSLIVLPVDSLTDISATALSDTKSEFSASMIVSFSLAKAIILNHREKVKYVMRRQV